MMASKTFLNSSYHNNDRRQSTRGTRTTRTTIVIRDKIQFKFMPVCALILLLVLCNTSHIPAVSAIGIGPTNSFDHCWQQRQLSVMTSCFGNRALSFLQGIEDSSNMTLFDGSLNIVKTGENLGTQSRSIVNFLDLDPTDFRGIMDGVSNVMSARSMKWDLDGVYPGLQMRVGPYHGMNSVLEFVLEPEQEDDGARKAFYAETNDRTLSVGRALTKSFLLPFLLGFKFNLSLVLPLLIGLLIIVGKKIVFISKLVLLLSGIFGWGVPFSGGLGYGQNQHYGANRPIFQDGFYRKEFHEKKDTGRRATYNIEVTEPPPYEFDRFYDYEKKQNRFDLFTTYEDEFKPRNEDRPIETNFQTKATKRQSGWRAS